VSGIQGKMKSLLHSKPDFFIVGAQKCGTTSLYNYLVKHPCVLPAKEKELHFFSDKYSKGYSWYSNQFPSLFKKFQYVLSRRHRVLCGEATPYYMFHPHAVGRIYSRFSNAKIIMMLRNPVDRAFSHYRYHVKLGAEDLTFEEAIASESDRLLGELDKMNDDANYNSVNYKIYSYLKRGVYIEQIERWIDLFSKDQILIIKSEDFFADPEDSFNTVLKFLELPEYTISSYKKFNEGKQVAMKPETREQLFEYFEPYNQRLYNCLGTDFGWDK